MAYKFRLGKADLSGSMTTDDIMFKEDEDTGIDFESDTIKFQTNGTDRLVVSNTGLKVETDMAVDTAAEPLISFKEGGSDRAEIKINDSDNLLITNQSSNKFVVFKTNDAGTIREGLRLGGTVPEVVVNEGSDSLVDFRVESDSNTHMLYVDGGNNRVGINVSAPGEAFEVNGNSYFSGSISFEDVIMTELSIPGIDLQTDTNAYRFNAPFNITVGSLGLSLDQHTTSGPVQVTVTNTTTNSTMITLSITGTNLGAQTTTVSNASVAQGDVITIAITNTPANAQGLRAILGFRRDL